MANRSGLIVGQIQGKPGYWEGVNALWTGGYRQAMP